MINTDKVTRKYRRNAYYYDFVTQAFSRIRVRAIAQLKLKPGDTVLDFGSGTGLSFALIESSIGPDGRIVGVELSPSMLAKAREKISKHKWENIQLIEGNAEEVNLPPASVDAVLSFYTHDIMSSPRAVERAVEALRPGGIFVAAGSKLAGRRRGWLLDRITLAYANTAITLPLTIDPWRNLEERLGPLKLQEYLLESSYIASGVKGS
ncbi:MAG TPA: class I SAM-dependent methyltransferase [Anaerolineales bacterium]